MRVSEYHDLHRIPLNGANSVDRLIFLRGLDAFGVIGPYLGSRRPVLTRQTHYPYDELPKALYLFVPRDIKARIPPEALPGYLLARADAYVFAWNCRRPEAELNARGQSPSYEPNREGAYVHSDAGYTWLHDPLRCDERDGPIRASAAVVGSGSGMFELRFRAYAYRVAELTESWAVAHDYFDLLPSRDNTTRARPLETVTELLRKREGLSEAALRDYAEWMKSSVPADHPVLLNADYRDETYVYEPLQVDRASVLTYDEVMSLEMGLLGLASQVERDGSEAVMEDQRFIGHHVTPCDGAESLAQDVVCTDTVYPSLPMAYFISGLDGDRPHSKALAFYQVLEHEARKLGRRGERSALCGLLEATDELPDETLAAFYTIAVGDGVDELQLRSKKEGFDRARMARKIYDELRNPTVHAGGETRNNRPASIHPYGMEQFQAPYMQLLRLTRELARHWVVRSGELMKPNSAWA